MTAELDTLDQTEFDRFLAACEADAADMDSEAVQLQIIARTLRATSVDSVLAPDAAVSSADYVNRPFTLVSARFSPSDTTNEGSQYFAVMQCVTPDGEPVVVTSGAGRVIAQVFKLREMDALPIQVVIKKSDRPSKSGNFPLWLEKADSF